jgi:hypothetical protein
MSPRSRLNASKNIYAFQFNVLCCRIYSPCQLTTKESCGYYSVIFLNSSEEERKTSDCAQAVSDRPLTTKARVRSQGSFYGICSGTSGTGTGFFFQALWIFAVPLIYPSPYLFMYREDGQ